MQFCTCKRSSACCFDKACSNAEVDSERVHKSMCPCPLTLHSPMGKCTLFSCQLSREVYFCSGLFHRQHCLCNCWGGGVRNIKLSFLMWCMFTVCNLVMIPTTGTIIQCEPHSKMCSRGVKIPICTSFPFLCYQGLGRNQFTQHTNLLVQKCLFHSELAIQVQLYIACLRLQHCLRSKVTHVHVCTVIPFGEHCLRFPQL